MLSEQVAKLMLEISQQRDIKADEKVVKEKALAAESQSKSKESPI